MPSRMITRRLAPRPPEGRAPLPPGWFAARRDALRARTRVRARDAGRVRGRDRGAHGGARRARSRGVPPALQHHALGDAARRRARADRLRTRRGRGRRRRALHRDPLRAGALHARGALTARRGRGAAARRSRARARRRGRRDGSSSAGSGTSIRRSRWSSPSSPSPTAAAGVVGFDLAGGEKGHPARDHAAAFEHARRHDLAVTVHAGEGDGAESVRQAVHDCGAHRIGHGTRLGEDPSLTQYVNDRRIALEICLTSNVQTHAAKSYAAHPLRGYFDRGMNVVLNTDNRMMSGVTLTDEYAHAAASLGFTRRRARAHRAQRLRERVPSLRGPARARREGARRARRDGRVTRAHIVADLSVAGAARAIAGARRRARAADGADPRLRARRPRRRARARAWRSPSPRSPASPPPP